MSDAIDTTTKPPPEPGRFQRRVFAANVPPTEPVGPRSFGLYLRVTDGNLYAVEVADGWRPCRAIGPLQPDQVPDELSALPWGDSVPAFEWDASRLVRVCDAERARMREGMGWHRGGRRTAVASAPMTPKGMTQPQRLQAVKIEAESAILAGQNVVCA